MVRYDLYNTKGSLLQKRMTEQEVMEFTGLHFVKEYAEHGWDYKGYQITLEGAAKTRPGMLGEDVSALRRSFTPEMLSEWRVMNLRYGTRFRKQKRSGQI